ncbi:MAG TPA: hypothetical protein VKD69_11930 [Vicinamibacterales bacterium]|nr:hypothetical protein [Vicinamibacterales bacterium]
MTCDGCGFSSLVAVELEAPAAHDTDAETRRVERLVRMIFDDRPMPCELQGLVRTAAGWQVTARVRQRDVLRFDLTNVSFAAMRAEIERALDS